MQYTSANHSVAVNCPDTKLNNHNRQLLVVDDYADSRLIASGILNSLGFVTEHAKNGLQAIEKMKFKRYLAVLMDLEMPVMDGFGAAKFLKSIGTLEPVFAMTASSLYTASHTLITNDFDGFMHKPLTKSGLHKILEPFLVG
jgi:two-component system sensor histidine kinase/response regulator